MSLKETQRYALTAWASLCGVVVTFEKSIKALLEGWIAGAALDTHYYYPMPPEHPLWKMPNVIMTPHISGSSGSPRFVERVSDIFIENVKRFINHEPILNALSAAQLRGE